jgi:hypothetical protein
MIVPEWLPATECGHGNNILSEVRVAGVTYRAVFRSGVFAFDASLKRCFIAYYLPDPGDWIDQISASGSGGALTLLRDGKAVAVYTPVTRMLEHPLLK